MPTVKKRSAPGGTFSWNVAGPMGLDTDPEATGVTSARAAAGTASETISAHSARARRVIGLTVFADRRRAQDPSGQSKAGLAPQRSSIRSARGQVGALDVSRR